MCFSRTLLTTNFTPEGFFTRVEARERGYRQFMNHFGIRRLTVSLLDVSMIQDLFHELGRPVLSFDAPRSRFVDHRRPDVPQSDVLESRLEKEAGAVDDLQVLLLEVLCADFGVLLLRGHGHGLAVSRHLVADDLLRVGRVAVGGTIRVRGCAFGAPVARGRRYTRPGRKTNVALISSSSIRS